MATNETGSHFVASLCCASLKGDDSLDYDGQAQQSAPLTEPASSGVYSSCSRQSVTAGGTVVYQRTIGDDWNATQILLAHP